MCTKPIRIKNNAKYINTISGMPYYLYVNCGHCAECIKAKQTEWNLRTFYMCDEQLKLGKYIYFDTLTYSNDNLPRLNKGIYGKSYACFDYRHIRYFYERLRKVVKSKFGEDEAKALKYFIVSEYGELRRRPHYHIMVFAPTTIGAIELSSTISKIWHFGRTDGYPYKSKRYVEAHNVIKCINMDCIRYIAKYVNKSQHFMDIIDQRWKEIEKLLLKKYDKLEIKRRKRKYYQLCTPFHRQSQHFGESALEKFNLNNIHNGMYYKDNSLKINQYCATPMYFIRKLTQRQIKYNDKRIWINTDEGIAWRKAREKKILDKCIDRIKDAAYNKGIAIKNAKKLAYYMLFQRSRLSGEIDYKDHKEDAEFYNYNTDRDLQYLGKKCISNEFAGNDKIGYCTTAIEPTTIDELIYIDEDLEKLINQLFEYKDTKELVLLKEHLNELKKVYFT